MSGANDARQTRGGGSRYLYEPFDVAAVKVDALERVVDARWDGLERRLDMIESVIERIERRIWIAVYGIAAVVVADSALLLLERAAI